MHHKEDFKALAPKVSGRIRTAFATGEGLGSSSTYPSQIDSKATGKTLRRNADFTEFSCSSTRKTLDNLPKDSSRPLLSESLPIL